MFCVKFTNESEPTVTEQNSDMPIFNPTVIDTDTQPANKMVKGKILDWFVSRRQIKVSMNLVRCDAHREVLETILEKEFYGKSED